jgi:hypothetical protein
MTVRQDRAIVRRLCETAIAGYRAVLKEYSAPTYARWPTARRPCHTCAFNPGTDAWDGFDSTVLNLAAAIAKGEPFYCHENLPRINGQWYPTPGLKGMQLCAGWAVIMRQPATKEVFARAICAVNGERDPSPEKLAWTRRLLDEWLVGWHERPGASAIEAAPLVARGD